MFVFGGFMISFSRTMTPLGEVVLGFGDRGLAVLEFADCFGGDVAPFGDAAGDTDLGASRI